MFAPPYQSVHDSPVLLGDLRLALSPRPELADHPRRLAEHLKADEQDVRRCLDVLYLDDELLP